MPTQALHPAENRGYRELFVVAQQLVGRWRRLAERERDGDADARVALERGADTTERLLTEVSDRLAGYGVFGSPAARGLGARIASARAEVGDRFLERNQALRLAVADVHRLRVLLDYLAAIAESRDDAELRDFDRSWERRLGRVEGPVRRAAAASGADPDRAVEPIDTSPSGQAAHRLSYAVGNLGEWVDAKAARRRSRG
jgi:hypothetical protein